MKHMLFLSPSELSQNLMELIVPTIPRKIHFQSCRNLGELQSHYFSKPVTCTIIDERFLMENNFAELSAVFEKINLKKSKKILFYTSQGPFLRSGSELGFDESHAKPFLAEELKEIIRRALGLKKR